MTRNGCNVRRAAWATTAILLTRSWAGVWSGIVSTGGRLSSSGNSLWRRSRRLTRTALEGTNRGLAVEWDHLGVRYSVGISKLFELGRYGSVSDILLSKAERL